MEFLMILIMVVPMMMFWGGLVLALVSLIVSNPYTARWCAKLGLWSAVFAFVVMAVNAWFNGKDLAEAWGMLQFHVLIGPSSLMMAGGFAFSMAYVYTVIAFIALAFIGGAMTLMRK